MCFAAPHVEVDQDGVFVLAVEVFLCADVVAFHAGEEQEAGQVDVEERSRFALLGDAERGSCAVEQAECIQFVDGGGVDHLAIGGVHLAGACIVGLPGEGVGGKRSVRCVELADYCRGCDFEAGGIDGGSAVGIDQDKTEFVGVLDEREEDVALFLFFDRKCQFLLSVKQS